MPVLPTTDGPVHRYYVGVLHDLIVHAGTVYEHAYAIRYPFPPYATQYMLMLGLTWIWDVSTSEKIFAVITILVTAYGFRSLARKLGRNGDVISLAVSSLLLPWSLWMGFFNYTLAVGLSLVALSVWLGARNGRPLFWFAFVPLCVLVMATHPVPLLMLLAATGLELAYTALRRERSSWLAVTMLTFEVLIFLYPLAIGGGTHAGASFADYGFHPKRIARQLLFFGLSPYAVSARAFLPNLYRIALYAIGGLAIYLGWRAWKQARRASDLRFVNLLLPAGIVLGVAMLVLPDSVSGSFFFATRLITFVWIALLLSACDVEFPSTKSLYTWMTVAVAMCVITALAASFLIRPVARQLAALDTGNLPVPGSGLVIDPTQDLSTKPRGSLEFSPYHWAGAIPLYRAHQLMLNSPWLEQAIEPVTVRPGSHLLNSVITSQDVQDINMHDGTIRWLSQASMQPLLQDTSFIFLRTPFVQSNLADQIGQANAPQFVCTPHQWYALCIRTGN